MSEHIDHHCGVVAVVDLQGKRDVVADAILMAKELQHRGQLAWGRAGTSLHDGELWSRTNRGRVITTMEEALRSDIPSASVIAHTRYATNLCMGMEHPVVVRDPQDRRHSIAFAFNGNIPDTSAQEEKLKQASVTVADHSDTEVIAQLIAQRLRIMGHEQLPAVIRSLGECDGAMNGVVLTGDGRIASYRDRHGFHPLVQAEHDGKFAIASEDHAIRKVWPDCKKIEPVAPGEMFLAAPHSAVHHEQLWEPDRKHCFFEWTYFAKRFSTLDGTPVQRARYMWGEMLADLDKDWTEERLIVPVPDSAKLAALGYADQSGQRYIDLMMRKSHDRTFIEPIGRDEKVRTKYQIDPELVKGKTIVVVEDSIVRGTTMRGVIERLKREAQPAAIHLRIACPPITHECYYGIDFKTPEELLVPKHTHLPLQEDGTLPLAVLESIARDLGVNSIRFLPQAAVAHGLQKSTHELCMGCVTGHYPTANGRALNGRKTLKVL